ncbi:MarR family transcriptional regulator [Mycobacterium sp. SVM_VP21]|nr:MarR family transcriptional regulator [Mycobacterium sp. SVM_VP21]
MYRFSPGQINGGGPELDLAQQKSWHNYLTTVLRMSTLLNRKLTDAHGISLDDVRLLSLLDSAPEGSVQMGELVEALPSLPSRLTRQVRRLEEENLVQRTTSPHDRRRVIATITEAGRILVGEAMTTYANEVQTHFLGPLTRPQIAAMGTTCRQIGDALKSAQR